MTGSSRGLGRSIAAAAASGARVIATARRPKDLDDLAAQYPDRVRAVALDVTDPQAAKAAVEATIAAFGRLDVVVNNAGFANSAPIEEMTDDDFRAQVEANLYGVVNVTRAVALKGGRSSKASPDRGFALALAMLSVTSTSYALVQSLVNPALDTLRQSLHTDQVGVSWVLTSYLLSSALLTPILGQLGDRLGKRRLLVASLGLLVLGSVIAAPAHGLPVVVVGRVLQGAGGAVLPLAFGVIRDIAPGARAGSAVGIVAAMTSVGGGLGILASGPIIQQLGLSWLFWGPAILNGVVAILLWMAIPGSGPRSDDRVNWLAAFFLSLSLVCLLLPLSLGPDRGWLAPVILALFAGAVLFGAAWVFVEVRSRAPLVDMTVFRMRPVWTANLASLLFGVGLYSALGFIPSFLQVPAQAGFGLGESVTATGLLFVPVTAAQLVTGLLAGPLMRAMRPKTVLIVGAVPPVAGFLLLAIAHAQLWEVIVATVICGLGFGVGLSALSAVIVDAVPVTQTGAAAGMNANIRTIGGALGAAVVSTILGSHSSALGLPTETGYTVVFATLAAAALASLIACLLIPAAREPNDPAGQPASPEAEAAGLPGHGTCSGARAALATDADPR